MNDDELAEELFEHLVSTGAVVIESTNKDGEFLYRFTDKCKEDFPEIWEAAQDDYGYNIMQLWHKGFIEIEWQDDDQLVVLTDKIRDPQARTELTAAEDEAADELLRIWDADNME